MSIIDRIRNAAKGFQTGHGLFVFPHEQSRGKWQPNDFKKQIEAYHDYVYACIRYIAYTAASVQLRLYQRGKGNDKEIIEHRFNDLMKEVNPETNAFELKVSIFTFLESIGNTYLLLNPDRLGIPVEMWVLMGQYIKIIPGSEQFIDGYIFEKGGRKIRYEPEEIVHIKYPNPSDYWYGMSPLRAAAYAIDADEYIEKYRSGLFKRDCVPSTGIELEGTLKEPERKRLESTFKQKFGGFEKSGGFLVLTGGAKFKPLSLTPKELDFLNSQNANLDKICGIFGVPSMLLSKTEKVNRSNMEAAYNSFLRDCIVPKLTMIEEKFNEKLLPRYDDKDLYCKFDNPIPEDKKHKLAETEMMLKNYVINIDEYRAQIGMEPSGWGDKPLVPVGTAPLGEGGIAMPPKTLTVKSIFKQLTDSEKDAKWQMFLSKITPQERPLTKEMQKYFRRQRDVILSNLDKMKGYSVKEPLDYIIFSMSQENELLALLCDPYWRSALESAGLGKIASLGLDIDWDMLNPRVTSWLERKAMEITKVNDYTKEQLRQILIAGTEEGLGVSEIAERITERYKKFEDYRALRIARTEIVGASNFGGHEVLEEAGMEKHAWMTARDELVRESHIFAEAEGWIPLHDDFSNGCPYPGVGPASEVINCRCIELP